MIMNPNDGFGCGRSVAWEYKALCVISELKEGCGHLNIDNIIINITRPQKNRLVLVKITISCPQCHNKFEESAKKITQEYIRFYGMDKK